MPAIRATQPRRVGGLPGGHPLQVNRHKQGGDIFKDIGNWWDNAVNKAAPYTGKIAQTVIKEVLPKVPGLSELPKILEKVNPTTIAEQFDKVGNFQSLLDEGITIPDKSSAKKKATKKKGKGFEPELI